MISILLLVVAAVGMAAADDTRQESGPRITFPRESNVSLGKVAAKERISREVTFVNSGDAPLAVERIYADCSCVSAISSREVVEPGDSAVLKVTFNPRGHRAGQFLNVIKLKTNAPERVTRVYVTGNVIAD